MDTFSKDKPLYIGVVSAKAARFAVEEYHYSRTYPTATLARYGVWEYGKYIGAILYGTGGSASLAKTWKRSHDVQCRELLELTRVALREHEAPVSKMISISLKLLATHRPWTRLVVSFADPYRNHLGKIYQASNWIYLGRSGATNCYWDRRGKIWHTRSAMCNIRAVGWLRGNPNANRKLVVMPGKYRYAWVPDKNLRREIEKLAQPYPQELAAEAV